ncbi:DUF3108 domain-containing protein [Piscinibacter aquaticus]|uniref:DUF3108 domain-containing protein n=1 Tax=Piscinibacter aquaticus TaxID=392597 RepID=A0A5C6U3J9_9BURK|nr:DUF3108 domain-containing protein [Piscinibacter aquaticus]
MVVRTLPAPGAPQPGAPPAPAPAAALADRPARPNPALRPRREAPPPVAAAQPVVDPADRPAPPAEPVPDVPPLAQATPPPEPAASGPLRAEAAAAAPAASAAAGEAEGAPPPLYATQLPPPLTLRYELRRGRLTGSGDLHWRPEAGRYSLRLEGSVMGLSVLTQDSRGTLDAHGVVPERFTDQRARRPMVAANFEREGGRIRFSGPSNEVPWQPGVQDRLSWMVQLAAVAQAEPQRLAAGERIVMMVVGARGDASTWAFRSAGPEILTLFTAPLETVHLLREPRHPYDTRGGLARSGAPPPASARRDGQRRRRPARTAPARTAALRRAGAVTPSGAARP